MTDRTPRSVRRAASGGLKALTAAAVVALAAGCASPPSHFYTLSGDAAAVKAGRAMPANPAFLIQVPAVNVPEQVAKTQLVVQRDAARVDVLEEHRWASPPADEIRRALSTALTRRLGTIDVADAAVPPGVPVYRVSVDVQRFESWPGERAALDAVWSVRSLATQSVMTCRSTLSEPVGAGYDALVAGHRKAVGELAGRIAAGVRAMAAQPAGATIKNGAATPAAVRCPLDTGATQTVD
ncbi:PqiC family protein [Burkholderia plantarii]|uniref:PqiC family protein n=1 Tax=Burkholderia plantarii TaxID=41899 RepID=UPI0018DDC8CB|nr:PqiC family protein [Burkholderia plantarii]MBI0326283.1 membrane integrity-associated transporter subunit PqiC [Burkholderia plantarii]